MEVAGQVVIAIVIIQGASGKILSPNQPIVGGTHQNETLTPIRSLLEISPRIYLGPYTIGTRLRQQLIDQSEPSGLQ